MTKALVVTNCVTGVLVDGLKTLFPSWDVRGAMTSTAREWITDQPNAAFQAFLADTSVLLTSVPGDPMFATLPARATTIDLPGFSFWGLQPDSFYVTGPEPASAAKAGTMQSRIAVTAFLLGWSWQDAVAAFNESVYQQLGYFAVYDAGRDALIRHYAAAGIDIVDAFPGWEAKGNYLYLHNHPKLFVMHDLLCGALTGRLLSAAELVAARPSLAELPDYLDVFPIWPVYPEIAGRHNIDEPFLWRTGRADGYEFIDLPEFLRRTWQILEQFGRLTPASVPGFEHCAAVLRG